jgi:GMP reductase
MMIFMDKAYKYSDIVLIPEYSECSSRSECETGAELCGFKFKLPTIPANMQSVINMSLAKWMSENDYFYVMHRFHNDLAENIAIANSEKWNIISFSVGVQDSDKDKIHKVKQRKHRIDFLTIDIAHGHSKNMIDMIEFIRKELPSTKIIAGNVATKQAVIDLATAGADVVKVGIGQGSPCTTKDKTGFTLPMFTCVKTCANAYIGKDENNLKEVPIIADGGIGCNGDITKALVAGAKMVMAGGLFASCVDSPATIVEINGEFHKAYFGSASYENKRHRNHIEGKLNKIKNNGMTYEQKLKEIKQDLQSSISYAGGRDVSVLQKTKYLYQ